MTFDFVYRLDTGIPLTVSVEIDEGGDYVWYATLEIGGTAYPFEEQLLPAQVDAIDSAAQDEISMYMEGIG